MTGVWLSEDEQQAWRTYLRLGSLLPAALNRQLQQDCGLTLPEYEVLVALSEAAEQRLRPFQICDALNWEQSRLSHQLTRMERRGLVERQECPADGRGAFIALTTAGAEAIREAAPAARRGGAPAGLRPAERRPAERPSRRSARSSSTRWPRRPDAAWRGW